MNPDRPITTRHKDRLGFGQAAQRLAAVIAETPAKDGMVFGIEGRWGSGKTTLINLTIEALRELHDPPEIVLFSPWLVGDRDSLLLSLFGELAKAAAKIDPIEEELDNTIGLGRWERFKRFFQRDAHWRLRQKERLRKRLGNQLKAFGIAVTAGTKFAKLATIFFPGGEMIGRAVESGKDALAELARESTLSARKDELVAGLRFISRRIAVFVDDLDRLEPREASEVLRLIRAVADFPNVVYVLSYDPTVLARTLRRAVQVDNGSAFLEKIVQASFRVPRPQAFDLRLWFRTEVEDLFKDMLNRIDSERLYQVIDVQGGRYLETPRDVVRALNALRLHALPVRDRIDIPDMVWLQLAKIGKPQLYDWVEEYMTNVAGIVGGATLPDEAARDGNNRLEQFLAGPDIDMVRAKIDIALILPGMDCEFGDNDQQRPLYKNLTRNTVDPFVLTRRLGSPQHFRYYFAFAQPVGALTDDVLQAYVGNAQDDLPAAYARFEALTAEPRPQGGTMAEVLIDRLIAVADKIPQAARIGVVRTLARSMDAPALNRNSDFGKARSWLPAEHLVERLFATAELGIRAACIDALFTEGQSLGWITSILRSEIFNHGHYGDQRRPPDQWLLTEPEFNQVLAIMLARFRTTEPAVLFAVPNLISLLYARLQGARNDEVRGWVEAQTQTDRGLLDFLLRARGWRASNGVVYHPLQRRDLTNFLDYDLALARLRRIAEAPETGKEDRQIALELLQAADQDSSW
ncbi:MAG TPA: P-loop NTPase fold protein [Terriglobales bacterium]|nr:P-loop NTPase fold protein [Terriglobales bacterium]